MLDRVEPREKDEEECVRKWMLDDLCDLDRNESWFSDMAEQGLFVDHFGIRSIWFKRGTPRKTRYRMDVLSRKLTEDELALYDSCGWHFAALAEETHWRPVYYYIFQTDENAGVPELHTDPMEQAESLKKLRRAMRWELWFGLAETAVLIWWTVWEKGQPGARFDRMVNGAPAGTYGLLVFFMTFLKLLGSWRNVRRLHRRLAAGEPLDHRADYRGAHRRYAVIACLGLAPLVWLLAMTAAPLVQNHARPLPEAADFPVVRLEEFYGGALKENGLSGELYHEWTPTGVVIDDIREKGNDAQTNSILEMNTVCYRLPFAWMAAQAFEGLKEEEWHRGLSEVYWLGDIAPVKTELVDEAWMAAPAEDNWNYFVLLVRDGRYIVTTFYLDRTHGNFDDPAEAAAFRDQCAERLVPMLARKLEG